MEKTEALNVKLAYIAGLFDGDGCVTADYKRQPHSINVTISNDSRVALEFVADVCGGNIYERTRGNSYTWQLFGHAGAAMLKRILPYLIIKEKQAIVAIAMMHSSVVERGQLSSLLRELHTPVNPLKKGDD